MTLLLAGFFAFVMLGIAGAGLLYQRWAEEPEAVEAGPPVASTPADLTGLLVSVGRVLGPSGKDDKLRSLLFRAGHRSPFAVPAFHGTQVLSGVLLAVTVDWILLLLRGGGSSSFLTSTVCAFGIGYLVPKRVLEWQVRARAFRLRSALAPALDLIVLALEAGQTIDQAILEASRSVGRVYPELASELTFCSLEMRAGTRRNEALRRMGERCGEDEIRKLVTVLVDGERFGTSLGPALRSHAHYLRLRMRHRAQEASRKLTVKLIMPVFFLIFPAVLLVTLGPAYLQLRMFLGQLLK